MKRKRGAEGIPITVPTKSLKTTSRLKKLKKMSLTLLRRQKMRRRGLKANLSKTPYVNIRRLKRAQKQSRPNPTQPYRLRDRSNLSAPRRLNF